jgi:hypothetical protein
MLQALPDTCTRGVVWEGACSDGASWWVCQQRGSFSPFTGLTGGSVGFTGGLGARGESQSLKDKCERLSGCRRKRAAAWPSQSSAHAHADRQTDSRQDTGMAPGANDASPMRQHPATDGCERQSFLHTRSSRYRGPEKPQSHFTRASSSAVP